MHKRALAAFGASILFLGGLAGPADAAFDRDELKCRKAVAKSFLKAITTGDKTSASCHKSRNAGKIADSLDCNDLASADIKDKFAKSQSKLTDTVQKKCIDAGIDEGLLAGYVSCTAACTASLGLSNPLASYAELQQCLPCVARELVETRSAAILGSPDQSAMVASKEARGCANAIAKGYGKHLSTILKTRSKCQDAADKAGADRLDTNCRNSPDPDSKGKIAGALVKAEAAVDKSCAGADLVVVDSCATASLPDLKVCLEAENAAMDAVAFPAHYQLEATICPTGVRSRIIAGVGINGFSPTFLDVGWKGLAHKFDLPDDYSIEADISCPASEPPCGVCAVTGLRKTGGNAEHFMRCTHDFSIKCDEPFLPEGQGDVDDCGGSPCTMVLGPPIPISAGGTPTCSITALAEDISGTTDVVPGEAALNIRLASRVYNGTSTSTTVPCPVCSGDDVAADGVRNGICIKGARDGLPCDTQAFDATFAAQSAGLGLSLDCVPASIENISGAGLIITLPLSTGPDSLVAESPCDSPLDAVDCFCGICSNDTVTPRACRNDSDCVFPGTCTSNTGPGAPRQPNDCEVFTNCEDVGEGRGECSDRSEFYCEGLVRASGEGFLACLDDDECINPSFPCPGGDCGPCTLEAPRACFLDPITVSGTPDPSEPILAATYCQPPTINPGINNSGGLPGPGRVKVQQITTLLYE